MYNHLHCVKKYYKIYPRIKKLASDLNQSETNKNVTDQVQKYSSKRQVITN